ncbi:aminotransferase class I/II-fold pyridoxal phosphate-dependent enzyme [Stutzerimonas stutzeri]|uniref:aminotransferase class I/II-fold pyridoxal phosphate-dependent enzyme n=1 Tax=Stutzerimonas stutzeri TaxID=316 RepID=UPI0022DE45EC|nr:aminotransferase class I/II-fold pyridoxal phosphate-dependent enzyme [Stutzerimonas stutzeri]WBL59219.1 aminotransferase class I/II-fold pyridoxal phosphate-dependent enzyme [Stutzerimonas stutzeri]
MQAIILAAGKGSRLGSYTRHNTKCMLEVNGEKLIDLSLQNLAYCGVKKAILVVGYQKANLIEYLGNRKFGVEIIYISNDDFDTTNNIYSLYLAREYLAQEDTLLLESDLIYDRSILEGVLSDERPSLAVVDKYQSWMDGTVVTLDKKNRITNFVPKKFFDYSNIKNYYKTVNIYKFSKEFSVNTYVPFLESYSKALGNNEYYEQVLRVILQLENQELQAYPLNGERWYEIDDIQDKDNAEVVFAKTPSLKLKRVQQRYGGYWRYPRLIDFCYLVNPYFPDEVFLSECQANLKELITQYPSGSGVQSLLAAKLFEIEPSQIVVTNGAAESIKVLSKVLSGTFGILEPTFYEYIDAIDQDRIVSNVVNSDGLRYGIVKLFELSEQADNIILINPDNPSGNFIGKQDVTALLEHLKIHGKHLILDESFIDFAENGFTETLFTADLLKAFDNLVVIKSISKSYGVPGIRLGVTASSNTAIIRAIDKETSIWNINSFGEFFLQIIGKYKGKYEEGCKKIVSERARLISELSTIPFIKVHPSEANYILCQLTQGYKATTVTQTLLFDHSLYVKDLTGKNGFEGKEFLRIAVRDEIDNDTLVSRLRSL